MTLKRSAAAAAVLALVQRTQAWNVELPSCTAPYEPFTYVGCFADTAPGEPMALIYRSSQDPSVGTVEKCSAECKGNGFRLAGLSYYGQCYCGGVNGGTSVPESQCNAPCNGNKTEMCGQNGILSVYEDPTFPTPPTATDAYKLNGCYSDNSSKGRALSWSPSVDQSTFTVEKCQAACLADGFPFAGVENGQECWCGNELASDSSKLDDSMCPLPCRGDSSEKCGGPGTLNVYEAKGLESTEPCGSDSGPGGSSSSSAPPSSTTDDCGPDSTPASPPPTTPASPPPTTPASPPTTPASPPTGPASPPPSPSGSPTQSPPPPGHSTTEPNPPPSHTSEPSPPPGHSTTKPNPPPSHTSEPSPPPGHSTTKPNPPPQSTTKPSPPGHSTTKPNPPPQSTTKPSPPGHSTTKPNPPPSHTTPKPPPSSHTSSAPAQCTTTVSTPPTCEYSCGNWCLPGLPDWDDHDGCVKYHASAYASVGICFKQAGMPHAIECFKFAAWCQDILTYCNNDGCKSGKKGSCSKDGCKGQNPPSGGSPGHTTTTVVPCPTSTTTKGSHTTTTTPTSCPPTPTNICTQPSNSQWGYGPGKPAGDIPLPLVSCNDDRNDWHSHPFKLYNDNDRSKCPSYPSSQCGNACQDACKQQYDSCVDVYQKGCEDNANGRYKRSEKRTLQFSNSYTQGWGFGAHSPSNAAAQCQAQYKDCLAVNKNVKGDGHCTTFGW